MGKTIIITEKPSVAQEYKKVLKIQQKEKNNGYIQGHSPVLDKDVCITWCVGHLCELSYPEKYDESWKAWDINALPFLPKKYLYEVKSSVKDQFKIIKTLYHDKDLDAIYYAGDAGREGLYIQMLVRQMSGTKPGIDERIVWIDSYTESEILRGIKEAKPVSDYDDRISAAYLRAIEDYSVGINFSRALSCRFGKVFRSRTGAENGVIAVGRVMTCVLSMVVSREREIRNFKETYFYGITAKTGVVDAQWKAVKPGSKFADSPLLYNETGFKDQKDAEALINELNKDKSVTVKSVKSAEEKKFAPMLFNLAELQLFCSKKYKLSPDETLNVAQSLYEKKLTTYPRTDARVMSSAVAKEIKGALSGLKNGNIREDVIGDIFSSGTYKTIDKSKYTDDSQITDHYAIIPTGYISEYEGLSQTEKSVYMDIVDRFLAIFLPPAVYIKTEAVFAHSGGEVFVVSEKPLKTPGFLSLYGEEAGNGELVEKLKEGQKLPAEFALKEGKTTPPKRYTSGSMVIAMENAGKLIEDEELRSQIKGSGIGTSATRAAIIQKLCTKNLIKLEKKSQILTPTVFGEGIYDIVAETIPEFLTPEMTASWERGLAKVETGEVTYDQYLEKLEIYVKHEVQKIKDKNISEMGDYTDDKKMPCPKCGKGMVRENSKAWGCSRYKDETDPCDFVIWKSVAGKILSAQQVEKLLTTGSTGLIKGFRSKEGKSFDAKLKFDKEYKLKFVFPEKKGRE